MFISRKRYEADLEQARRKGMSDAWDVIRAYMDSLEDDETEEKTMTTEDTIPAVPEGEPCPPDRLDI